MPWLQYGDADEPRFYYLGIERPSDNVIEDTVLSLYEESAYLQATFELLQQMPWIVIDRPSNEALVRLIDAQTRTVKHEESYLRFLQNELKLTVVK